MPLDQIISGNNQDALNWIVDSNLSENDKEALKQFVRRFPGLKFYKVVDNFLNQVEINEKVSLPDTFRSRTI